jgi:hypothetical protein
MRILLILLSFISLPAWSEVLLPNATSPQTKCADWDRFGFSDFYMENNVWGKGSLTGYKQCLFRSEGKNPTFGWEWDWPQGAPDVASYPCLSYGWKPWNSSSTTPLLPLQLSKVKKALITYDLALDAEGIYNLSFDAWLTSEERPAEINITGELMIWLTRKTLRPDGVSSQSVTIDGEGYDFYHGKPPHAGWPYLAFIKKNDRVSGTTDLKKFLDFLLKNKHISKKDYLASIEFGDEVVYGKGRTEFKKYSVEIKGK